MRTGDYIPQGDQPYAIWARKFVDALKRLRVKLDFPQKDCDLIEEQVTDYEEKLAIVADPDSNSSTAVTAKNAAKKLSMKTIRTRVKAYLANNLDISDEDRRALGLRIPKTSKTPSAVAKLSPDTHVRILDGHTIAMDIFPQGGRPGDAKPDGQHEAVIRYGVGQTLATSLEELTRTGWTTNGVWEHTFDESERGQICSYVVCWVNHTGQAGVLSVIRWFTIP
jgi:hypothetical protein